MIRIVSSEWLKTKRTAIRWLTFFMPVVIALCLVSYLSYRPELKLEFIFETFFTVWTAIILPVGVGLLSGFLIQEEEPAGNFNGFLNTEISRIRLYEGKFLLLIFCLMSCTFIATLLLCVGMNLITPNGGHYLLFLAAALLAVLGTLPIMSIHLWVSLLWGMGASIGLGMGGLLMAALIGATNLGDKIWPWVPWAWPVKMSMFPFIFFSTPPGAIASEANLQFITALISTAIGLFLFLLGGILWFRNWEGRKSAGGE